jgi:hypothetical protein
MGRWVGGIATRIPGGLQAHGGRPGQLATPETNIGQNQVGPPGSSGKFALGGLAG